MTRNLSFYMSIGSFSGMWLINNHVGVSEDDNEAIGGQEYEDVPDSLEVGGGHGDDADASFPQ